MAGLTKQQHTNFFGLNGSATYRCEFEDVFVPKSSIIATDALDYVQRVRSEFVSYQIPLGFGVISASIEAMETALLKNGEVNKSIRIQPEELRRQYHSLFAAYEQLIKQETLSWDELIRVRLDVAYLTLAAVQAGMIHGGGAGYMNASDYARRLREAYFIVNLTPTVKHLEKIMTVSA